MLRRPRASWENVIHSKPNWRPLNWWRPCWTAFVGLVYGGGFMNYPDSCLVIDTPMHIRCKWDELACLVNIPDSVEKQWPQNDISNIHSTVCGCVQKPSYWICNHFNGAVLSFEITGFLLFSRPPNSTKTIKMVH